jgi:hypothetical protein
VRMAAAFFLSPFTL